MSVRWSARPRRRPLRLLVGATVVVTALGACTGAGAEAHTDRSPESGGTLTYLKIQRSSPQLDPQRIYLAEERAFAAAFLHRTLTTYVPGDDGAELTADLATDIGRPDDSGAVWTFELRHGSTFQDGSPITCADVAFGVSRAFDPDVIATGGFADGAALLDIPRDLDGDPVYRGPYADDTDGRAAFDEAVSCSPDGRAITFRLASPRADFGHAVSTLTFSPVPDGTPADADLDRSPVSSGPYRIDRHAPGQTLALIRNDAWDPESDPVRPASPDRVEVEFGVRPDRIAERLGADARPDAAVIADPLLSDQVAGEPELPGQIRGLDGGVTYLAVNTARVPELAHRQAILAALDRRAVHEGLGGDATGELADGIIPPTLGTEHHSTGLADELLGAPVPETGDPAFARTLLAAADQPIPPLDYAYPDLPENRAAADAVATSLARAGIEVRLDPLPRAGYISEVRAPDSPYELMLAASGFLWASAASVLPTILTPAGGPANLSRHDDPSFTADVDDAVAELDPVARADRWASLDRAAVRAAVVVPLRYTKQTRFAGTAVGGAAIVTPPGAWDYASLWVRPAGSGRRG